jgi:hypothetical protein
VSALEAGSVAFTGRTDPNAAVTVAWNGISKVGTSDGSGNWSTSFSGAEVPNPGASGGQEFPYTIAVTNLVGNVASASGNVLVDRVPPEAPTIASVTPDNIINAAEAAAGVLVSGTGERGSNILLDWGGRSASASVDGNGNWQVNFASGNLPADGNRMLNATAQDDAGNQTAGPPRMVLLETGAAPLAVTSVGGADGVVTLADAGNAVFVGTAAANAAISVVWNGIINSTTADGAGNWSVTYSGAQVPAADGVPVDYFSNTTSPAGNINSVTGTVVVDTVAPAVPEILTSQVIGNVFSATGTGTAGSAVTVEIDATPLFPGDPLIPATAPVDANGNWQISQEIELPPAALTVTVHAFARDPAGNLSATSADQNVPVSPAGGGVALESSDLLAGIDGGVIGGLGAGAAAAFPSSSSALGLSSAAQVAALAPLDPALDSYA